MKRIVVTILALGLVLAPACGGGDDGDGGDESSDTSGDTTSSGETTAQPAVESECDVLTREDLEAATGVALQEPVEDFQCSYEFAQGAGGVDVNFTAAEGRTQTGPEAFAEKAEGADVEVEGAEEAKFASFDTTGDITRITQTLYVLSDDGDYVTISLRGVDQPRLTPDQLVPAVEAALGRL